MSLFPFQSYTFMEIDHEILSSHSFPSTVSRKTVVSYKRVCMKYWLAALSSLPRKKSVDRLTDCLDMTIPVDWDINHKPNKSEGIVHIFNLFFYFRIEINLCWQ